MPLPDERHGQTVANLIGRFEQQTKKQLSSPPGPRSSSVVSHTTGDSAKEEVKEKREWPPRTSNVASSPTDNKVGKREWPPRLSAQGPGDPSGQRRPSVQSIIQTSPFCESKRSPVSPLAEGAGLATPDVNKSPPFPPAEIPEVIEVIPPSREPTLPEPEPPEPVVLEPDESPKTPPQPTIVPPATGSEPSSAVTQSPSKSTKTTKSKPDVKATAKPPPSSFSKGAPLHADPHDRRTSTSAQSQSRPTSRTTLRSKTPTSTPVRPPSSTRRKPPTETPKHTPTPVKRSKTPSTSPRQFPPTPSKPPPVIPKTPNSRLYAPTAASLAKSANSPQPPPPERKKTLSSGASLERLSKPTASSLSKSRSTHTLTPTTSPPKSKPTPTKMGTLNTTRKSTMANKPSSKAKPAGSTLAKDAVMNDACGENGNGFGTELSTTVETQQPEIEPSDAENHEPHSDREHEHLGNGSLEASYTEETSEQLSVHDHEEVVTPSVHQNFVEEPEELVRSHSPASGSPASDLHSESSHEGGMHVPEEPEQGSANDDIADMVGLLESTSFNSKHILRGSEEGVANDSHSPGSEKDRQRIGEIPDEE